MASALEARILVVLEFAFELCALLTFFTKLALGALSGKLIS